MKFAVCLLGCFAAAPGAVYEITTVSTKAANVTGGDVLVRVKAPSERFVVKQNGSDVTSAFSNGAALLRGLSLGDNVVEVFRSREDATPAASLKIINHPTTGPVFSGPHQQPFVCETSTFELPDGSILGEPIDANCSARTVVQYLYRSTAGGQLKVLPSNTELPADIASTVTSTGESVPYIVRVETGTINRAIYQIAMLAKWNRRLLYSFGGGCTEGWYRQGKTTALNLTNVPPGSLTDFVLGSGYAYASASLNVFGNNCQDVTAAETMMMVKEHFIERYGEPLFTFGRGGSGGAYQQVQIADNYPGLLDGIIPSATFPDVLATIQYLTDA
ncbi:MAG TPA: DUF6351 family protein, partial [Bryobacteraceae bacterium]|nr:DUF6351 family protein [Bryobacteraceae bacterium]